MSKRSRFLFMVILNTNILWRNTTFQQTINYISTKWSVSPRPKTIETRYTRNGKQLHGQCSIHVWTAQPLDTRKMGLFNTGLRLLAITKLSPPANGPKKKEEKRAFSVPTWLLCSNTGSNIMTFEAILQALERGAKIFRCYNQFWIFNSKKKLLDSKSWKLRTCARRNNIGGRAVFYLSI